MVGLGSVGLAGLFLRIAPAFNTDVFGDMRPFVAVCQGEAAGGALAFILLLQGRYKLAAQTLGLMALMTLSMPLLWPLGLLSGLLALATPWWAAR